MSDIKPCPVCGGELTLAANEPPIWDVMCESSYRAQFGYHLHITGPGRDAVIRAANSMHDPADRRCWTSQSECR